MSTVASASPEALASGVRDRDRRALARAITLVESERPDAREAARRLLDLLGPHAGAALRIGVSGAPGVGKSTFIETFGRRLIAAGRRVAVLAVDPTSGLSGGSILGDKTRMPELAREEDAFIRPSPAGHASGGVARRSREVMLLCEAAGYDRLVVETVGVGQAETAVAAMTDMFVLLIGPGGGDELQGIKRGIVELADLLLVNKADGELVDAAGRTAAEYANALRLLRAREPGWTVPAATCSALTGDGIDAAIGHVERFREWLGEDGRLESRRRAQARQWLWSEVSDGLVERLRATAAVRDLAPRVEAAVGAGTVSPGDGAARLIEAFLAAGGGAGEDGQAGG